MDALTAVSKELFQQNVTPWESRPVGSSWGRVFGGNIGTTNLPAIRKNSDGTKDLAGTIEWAAPSDNPSLNATGPRIEVPLVLDRLPQGSSAISFPFLLPRGTPSLSFELVDTKQMPHRSMQFRRHCDDAEQTRYTLLFADLEPPFQPGEIRNRRTEKGNADCIHVTSSAFYKSCFTRRSRQSLVAADQPVGWRNNTATGRIKL